MDNFWKAFKKLHNIEGGFVDDPDDAGGATRFGVTEAVARDWGYEGPMSEFPKKLAVSIYRHDYWDVADLDQVAEQDWKLAYEIFEAGVNCGVGSVGEWVQRCINILNKEGKLYENITVDGVIGPNTIHKIKILSQVRNGIPTLTTLVNVFQGMRYVSLCENNEAQEKFIYGWAKRIKLGD